MINLWLTFLSKLGLMSHWMVQEELSPKSTFLLINYKWASTKTVYRHQSKFLHSRAKMVKNWVMFFGQKSFDNALFTFR